jgi:hypothetical protein
MTRTKAPFLLPVLAAVTAIAAGPAPAGKGIEPDADRMLRAMTNYLASLQSFKVQSAAIDEVVLGSGQKIQFASESMVSVQRPNRLKSEQIGAANGLAFWYDGKQMTLVCKANNSFATLPAPKSIDATIDKVRKDFQIEAPGADLLYSRPYDILTEQVTGGRYIGRETIDGTVANHLAFEGEQVDWQIWIQDGSQPLPLRFVVTTKKMKGQPQFTVRLSHWEPGIGMKPATFQFVDTTNAQRVQNFPVECRPGSGSAQQ